MLIFATGGINIYRHYCICTEKLSASAVIQTTDCHEDQEPHICSVDMDVSCCQSAPTQHIAGQNCEESHNCCSTGYTFLKTDQFDKSFIQKRSFGFIAAYAIAIESVYLQEEVGILEKNIIHYDLPPPEYGKELLILLHQFKIASSLV